MTVSVDYGRALAQTLPKNIALFDEFAVVTTVDDSVTRSIATQNGATVVLSNRCYDDSHVFNKGRMINDGLAVLTAPEWIVLTDADIFLHPRTRAVLLSIELDPTSLYFTVRMDRAPVANQPDNINMEPNGYFQLFNRQAAPVRDTWPMPMCEEFCSAGGVDSWFFQQWPYQRLVPLPDIGVEHLSSSHLGQNWNGIRKRVGAWRQLGVLTVRGFATMLPMKELPGVIKLTDTKYGQSVTIETRNLDSYVRVVPTGLEFLGRELGSCHIHVAHYE